ncbi:MAG: hypothetical protein FWE13_00525 [Firmicutes bacterium]|nr:hypothetical protein [Bacillota bacterium]
MSRNSNQGNQPLPTPRAPQRPSQSQPQRPQPTRPPQSTPQPQPPRPPQPAPNPRPPVHPSRPQPPPPSRPHPHNPRWPQGLRPNMPIMPRPPHAPFMPRGFPLHLTGRIGLVVATHQGNVTMRRWPTRMSQAVGTIPHHTFVWAFGENNGWCLVHFNGQYGFVNSRFVIL